MKYLVIVMMMTHIMFIIYIMMNIKRLFFLNDSLNESEIDTKENRMNRYN